MKKEKRLEQGIFVLMKFLNGKIERKPSKIKSMALYQWHLIEYLIICMFATTTLSLKMY